MYPGGLGTKGKDADPIPSTFKTRDDSTAVYAM